MEQKKVILKTGKLQYVRNHSDILNEKKTMEKQKNEIAKVNILRWIEAREDGRESADSSNVYFFYFILREFTVIAIWKDATKCINEKRYKSRLYESRTVVHPHKLSF